MWVRESGTCPPPKTPAVYHAHIYSNGLDKLEQIGTLIFFSLHLLLVGSN